MLFCPWFVSNVPELFDMINLKQLAETAIDNSGTKELENLLLTVYEIGYKNGVTDAQELKVDAAILCHCVLRGGKQWQDRAALEGKP